MADSEFAERLFEEKPSFMLSGEITEQTAIAVLDWLGYWRTNDPKKKISVFIDSVGGELFAATSIAEAFNLAPNPIRTVATSKCYSGGALIAAAGDKGERYAYSTADFMIHQLQLMGGEQESVPERKESMVYIERLNDTFLRLLAEFTGKTLAEVRRDTKKAKYMSAAEAKEYGLIDYVAEWKKRQKITP